VGSLSSACLRSALVIYQDPLVYLLGLEGIALLDAWAGDHDRAFTDARLAARPLPFLLAANSV
jgi:ribosome biogenesis protein Tsr3